MTSGTRAEAEAGSGAKVGTRDRARGRGRAGTEAGAGAGAGAGFFEKSPESSVDMEDEKISPDESNPNNGSEEPKAKRQRTGTGQTGFVRR